MSKIVGNTINEIQKLFSKKKNFIFLIIISVICFSLAFLMNTIQKKVSFLALSSISFPLLILGLFVNVLLPLIIITVSAEMFSKEEENKTLKLSFLRPISRLKIFISKNIALAIYVMINLFVVFISSTFAGFLLDKTEISENFRVILMAYGFDLIPALIFILFSVFISQFFKSSSGTLFVGIFIFIILKALSLVSNVFNNIIFTSYLNWYNMFHTGNNLRNINTFFMIIAYGIVFFIVGFYIFDKKEV